MPRRSLVSVSFALFSFVAVTGCNQPERQAEQSEQNAPATMAQQEYQTAGSIERLDPRLDEIIRPEAKIEVVAEGFDWSEGPLWVPDRNMLLFTDIPPNRVHQWSEEGGLELYLSPAGYTGEQLRGGEVGANGLVLDPQGRLVLCQHGDRRVARMEAPLANPQPSFTTIADSYDGKKLNSPNDAVYRGTGDLYFTDPPYGLEKNMEDPAKELPFQGVYRVDQAGKVHLLTKELSRPNGIAFSPDGNTLYVANSDPERAIWMAYDVQEDGSIRNGRVFFDATSRVGQEKGLPDGLKVNRAGTLFATGPGGVLVFSPDGTHLGTIKTGQATSNCALTDDGKTLYMTADDYLMRVRLQ